MKQFINTRWLLLSAISLLAFACDPEEEDTKVVASFQSTVDANDFTKVQFNNFSRNAVSYSWNFGDSSAVSTVEDPIHIFPGGGVYEVTLTATGSDGSSATFSKDITITDPDVALTLLTGATSKTWKLFREGTSMQYGTEAEPGKHWGGLTNNGSRPCLYTQTFTFNRDGSYVFDDMGSFWGEFGVFDGTDLYETCFDATAENMEKADGTDVSAWLSGSHEYDYNVADGKITLTGTGAWIGIPKLGTTADNGGTITESVTFNASIVEEEGYDLLTVKFIYGADIWTIVYVSYSDASLEPELETDEPVFGEDLPDITPAAISHTFESATSFEVLGTIAGASIITPGENDPTNAGATKVGKYVRDAGLYQEAQLRTSPNLNDIQFDDFTTVSIDVYLPSTNTYAENGLTKKVIIGFGDQSKTLEWWTNLTQHVSDDVALDSWVTVTFQLDAPTAGTSVLDRTDLDMVFVQIGGGGHTTEATFYVRNLKFE